jgi:hypothetical protein
MLYSILADIVVAIHFLFILFVALGALFVLKWPWVIYLHLPAAAWGALIMFVGWICPLTPIENRLRISAGEAGYSGGFIDQYLMPVIYPAGLTRDIQIWLGLGVILLNMLVYGFVFVRRLKIKNVSNHKPDC